MRITYVARRAWPAGGGIENYLRFMTDALPAIERVQILAGRVDNGGPAFTDMVTRRPFPRFVAGQITTEPLRVRGAASRVRLAPVIAEPHLQWAPRGRGWLGRRSFDAFAAGVGPAIAAAADRPDVLHVFCGGNLAAAGVIAARRLGVPLVVTPQAHPGQWDDDPQSGRAYRAADRVLASGEADAEHLPRPGGARGAAADRAAVHRAPPARRRRAGAGRPRGRWPADRLRRAPREL